MCQLYYLFVLRYIRIQFTNTSCNRLVVVMFVQTTALGSVMTLDARFLHHQQQILLEQQRQLLQQQRQLAVRQQEMARRSATPSSADASDQMRTITLTQQQQQQQQQRRRQVSFSGTLVAPPTPNLMASEEIRVDCIQLATNGRYVVTGSIYGPPQVWDLKVAFRSPTSGSESQPVLHYVLSDNYKYSELVVD